MDQVKPATSRRKIPKAGEPVWELARLFPPQGEWSEDAYLALDTGRLIEYSHGFLEVLPMPTLGHHRIVKYLFNLIYAFIEAHNIGGEVLFAPLPLRIGLGQYREPDIVYLESERLERIQGNYPDGADIIVEVVSRGQTDRTRDLIYKRRDYALAGIPEYWIVDPQEEVIIVLHLEGNEYAEHGRFSAGDAATSALLPGFSVPVGDVWAAAK